MELLEGEPLSARLARGPLPVAEAVPLALAMLSALAALHRPQDCSQGPETVQPLLTPHGLEAARFRHRSNLQQDLSVKRNGLDPRGLSSSARRAHVSRAGADAANCRQVRFFHGRSLLIYEMMIERRSFIGNNVVEIMHAVISDQPKALVGSAGRAGHRPLLNRAMADSRGIVTSRPRHGSGLAPQRRWPRGDPPQSIGQ